MVEEDLRIEEKELEGGLKSFFLKGELDAYSAPRLKEQVHEMIDQGEKMVVINLDKLGYIDSSGLGVLIGILKKVREKAGDTPLVCNNETILRLLEITGLDRIFNVFSTTDKAVEHLNAFVPASATA